MKNKILFLCLFFFSLSSHAQSLKKIGLIFDQTTYNFGDVEQWNNQPAIFTFTNKSKMSLTILPLFSENDLDVVIPDRPIEPGETIIIKAIYYTDGKGPFSRKFPIYFGSRAEPIYLKISGNIKSLSPQAYIQCPMSKPEMSKPRIELIGDVAEIDTEIPLSGTTIEIIGLQNRKEITLFTNSKGKFGAKLPTGNYMIKLSHPNYQTYTGSIYIGQTSPPLRVRLTPLEAVALFVENTQDKPEEVKQRDDEKLEQINSKNDKPKTSTSENEPSEKVDREKPSIISKEEITPKEDKPITKDKLDRDIDYVKNEPVDNAFSKELDETEQINDIPQTLTTYKENNTAQNTDDKPNSQANIEEAKPEALEDLTSKEENLTAEKDIPQQDPNKEVKEKKPKENNKPVIEEEEEKDLPKNLYTFRVIDEKSLDPIENASIYLNDLYDKKNKHKEQTDIKGFSELEIIASDYRFIATADGYISNEIRIQKDDKDQIFKIFLRPVSDLYADIYEAKKERAKENEELLSKLSFGKTEFSFANEEDPKEIETAQTKESLNNELTARETKDDIVIEKEIKDKVEPTVSEPIIVEKIIADKEKEDSLKRIIAQLEDLNKKDAKLEEKANLEEEKRAQEIAKNKETEQEKIDSLNNYIALLTAKNNAIENDLEKIATDKEQLKAENLRDKEKLEALEALNSEINEAEIEKPFSSKKYQANNIMFLIDVSTSMEKEGKMDMLKTSIKNLVEILRDIDRVAIITYNQKTNVVLESISGDNKTDIIKAIDSLKTGGLTNGVKGLTTAYEMLEYYYIPNGNNQIILATDGLFSKYNNEMTETELNRLVKKQADKNMKLTVVGFGKDEDGKELMNKLAKNGTGQYIQIKNEYMTRDVLIREIKLNSEISNKE